jgi:L-iditol 2-dehydrogenase
MRGVRFLGDRRVVVATFPHPQPGPGEVVVEMRAAGLCGSDLHHFRLPAASGEVPAVIVGHEPCGVVVEVGDGVRDVRAGARVVVNHHYGCGACLHCRDGSPKYCTGPHGTYGFSDDGADGEYMLAHATALAPLPDALSFEDGAAAACGAGTAFAALRRLQLAGGEAIAIFGQGPVGLTATLLAGAMGARVIAVDVIDERLALARASGADDVVDARSGDAAEAVRALTSGCGAAATLDCSGSSPGRVAALDAVALRGRVCFVGVGPPTEFDVSEVIIGKELTCHGSWTFTSSGLIDCMAFLAERELPLASIVSHRFAIERAGEAFALFDGGRTGKCLFVL